MLRKNLSTLLVAGVLALAAASAATAADETKFPLELTIRDEAGNPVVGAAVTIAAASGEPFNASGTTTAEGRYDLGLPDFSRSYQIKVVKEAFLEYDKVIDLAAQNFKPGTVAQVGLTLQALSAERFYNDAAKLINAGSHKTAQDGPTVVEMLTQATTLKPDLIEAWRALSFVYLDTNRPEEALAAADRTLALAPTDAEGLRSRYDALIALGRKEEAATALDALVEQVKTPDTARLLFNRGVDAMKVPDTTLAKASFQRALTVDPKLHQAHSALAEVAIGEKNYTGALVELDQVLAIAPRNFKAWERKVEVLKAAGKTKEAAEAEKALAAAKAAPAS